MTSLGPDRGASQNRQVIRLFILGEGASFLAAALVHFGVLLRGYEHHAAGTAETVIGSVLLIGLASSWMFPRFTRGIGIGVQAFALLGTLVGILTIIVGIGPRTVPDIAYHIIISIALISGLVVAFRARPDELISVGKTARQPVLKVARFAHQSTGC